MVGLASPEEQAAAEATIMAPTQFITGPIDGPPILSMGKSQWQPPAPPAGPPEPTECW
jgi:hypothetical protein